MDIKVEIYRNIDNAYPENDNESIINRIEEKQLCDDLQEIANE